MPESIEPGPAMDGCVAIVDDQELARLHLARLVGATMPSIKTKLFETGADAWCWVCSEPEAVDLIVTDGQMPCLTGIQLIDRVRSDARTMHIPVMLVTVDQERSVRQAALSTGATDFLTRPFDADEYAARCLNLIRLSRHRRSALRTSLWRPALVPPKLSRREAECLSWTSEGKTAWEISVILGLSERTVSGYIQSTVRKLGCSNKQQAVAHALRTGILR